MRPESDTHRISARAARQKGLVTRAQLERDDVPYDKVKRLVRAKLMHPVHRSVWTVGHSTLTPQARWLAAVYALGDDAVLSARAAGQLWRIVDGTDALDVTVPTTAGIAARDDIDVHRQPLSPHERTRLHGIPVTTLVRTVIDIAVHEDECTLERAFEEAQVRHRLKPVAVAAALLARPGHRGTARLRVLTDEAVDPGRVESHLELRFLRFCRDHRFPRPLQQVWFGRHRADFYFPDANLVVETDSRRFHATAAKRRADAEKTAALEGIGVRVKRLRWRDIVHAPQITGADLRAALGA